MHYMPNKESSFDESMQQLGSLVETLEANDLPLEQALETYEKGIAVANACMKRLREAELRIEQVSFDGDEN